MSSFKRTLIPSYPRIGAGVTADTLYWRKLGFPFIQKEFGAIAGIDYCQVEPYNFVACSASKVQLFDPSTNQIISNISRSKSNVHCASFRSDGKLLISGDEDGLMHLYETSSKSRLKLFKGHTRPIWKCAFTKDDAHVVSFSDDKSVGVWNIATEERIHSFSEHIDYVRAGAASSSNPDIFFSGSYDHKVKMFDVRVPTSVWTVDHGDPVNAILVLPNSGIVISAGGTVIKVWDAVAGGSLLAKITQHNKSVTCLALASEGRRIMSGSLDCHVKIYDVATYQSVHTINYASPILSVGAAPDDSSVAVGMTDGSLSIQQRSKPVVNEVNIANVNSRRKKASYKYSLEAQRFQPSEDDVIVKKEKRKGLEKYDTHLKKFNHSKALDTVLVEYRRESKPEVVVAVLKELIARRHLQHAIAGKSARDLCVLLHFLQTNINDVRFHRVLIDVTNIVLDIYANSFPEETRVRNLLKNLLQKLNREVNYMKELMTLKGTMEMILAAGSASSDSSTEISNLTTCYSAGSESNLTKLSF